MAERPNMVYSVSHTTRDPRSGEADGVDYYFIGKQSFKGMAADGEFAEWAEVFGRYYGTSKAEIARHLDAGRDVLLIVDVQGAAQLLPKYPEAVSVFLVAPDDQELERRLRGRGSETEENIRRRLDKVAEEMQFGPQCKHIVVNDEVERAVKEILTFFG